MDESTIRDAFAAHEAFAEAATGYALTTTPVDTVVHLEDGEVVVEVLLPTLNEVVTTEPVPAVVEESWRETMTTRLQDGYDVVHSRPATPPTFEDADETLAVTYRLHPEDSDIAADAKALIEFAVGTYVQSAIPGYEYDEPLRSLLASARARGDAER